MTEIALIHLGKLVSFCCKQDKDSVTTLCASVYCHSTFSKVYDFEKHIITKLNGNWTILKAQCVANSVSCTTQPCILLLENVKQQLHVFSLKKFNKIVKEIKVSLPTLPCHTFENFSSGKAFIMNGPALLFFDITNSKAILVNKSCTMQVMLPNSLVDIFVVHTFGDFLLETLLLLTVQSNEVRNESCMVERGNKPIESQWKWMQLTIQQQVSKINICFDEGPTLPNVYSSLVNDVLLWKNEEEYIVFLLTNSQQVIMVKDGNVVDCCDLSPHTECYSLKIVGSKSSALLFVECKNKIVLAIPFSTFKVQKTWDNVEHTVLGAVCIPPKVLESVLILQTQCGSVQIQPEQFSILTNLEDILVCENKSLKVNGNAEVMDDLFLHSPPVVAIEEVKNNAMLNKVFAALDGNKQKLMADNEHFRDTLCHKDEVIKRTRIAIRQMNNDIEKTNKQKCNPSVDKKFDSGLVDLFSGEPATTDPLTVDLQKVLDLGQTWKKTIGDHFFFGFEIKNCSTGPLSNMSVVLSPKCPTKELLTIESKVYKLEISDTNCDIKLQSGRKEESSTSGIPIDNRCSEILVSNEIASIVVSGRLPDFNHDRTKVTFDATIVACKLINEACNENRFLFSAGELSLTANEIATGSLEMDPIHLIKAPLSEDFTRCMITTEAYCSSVSRFTVWSKTHDVAASLKILLQSLDFACNLLTPEYICAKRGALYLTQVQIDPVETRRAKVVVRSRSKNQSNLLISFFGEQMPRILHFETCGNRSSNQNTSAYSDHIPNIGKAETASSKFNLVDILKEQLLLNELELDAL